MNIGSEMPSIIYADEYKVIISGDCKIVVYDLNNKIVSERLSYEFFVTLGVEFPYAFTSPNGTAFFFCL